MTPDDDNASQCLQYPTFKFNPSTSANVNRGGFLP